MTFNATEKLSEFPHFAVVFIVYEIQKEKKAFLLLASFQIV